MRGSSLVRWAIYLIWLISISSSILVFISVKDHSESNIPFNNEYEKNLEISSYWNLTGTYMRTNISYYGSIETNEAYMSIAGILIDEKIDEFSWNETAAAHHWCHGSGTKEDPYIIENVYIDGEFIGKNYLYYSNILIRHSRAHFIIRNSSLHRSGTYADWNAGIFLYNTTNGMLLNNNCTYNRGSIQLFESHNNTIASNNLLSNHNSIVGLGAGIYLGGYGNGNGSCNNHVEYNIIINHYSGVIVFNSINNRINRNFLNNTLFGHFPDTGIYLSDTNYSYITYNSFAGDYADYPNPDGDFIVNQQNCVGNNISSFEGSNIFIRSTLHMQNSESWFTLENSNYNHIYGNKLLKSVEESTLITGFNFNIIFITCFLTIISITVILKKRLAKISNT